jgi:hypothetical protein
MLAVAAKMGKHNAHENRENAEAIRGIRGTGRSAVELRRFQRQVVVIVQDHMRVQQPVAIFPRLKKSLLKGKPCAIREGDFRSLPRSMM